MKVVFSDFDLQGESDYRCRFADTLKFYDGASSMSNIIGTYCGTVHPDVIFSTGQSLYVKFYSHSFTSYPLGGFSFSYSAVKKGTVTDVHGLDKFNFIGRENVQVVSMPDLKLGAPKFKFHSI